MKKRNDKGFTLVELIVVLVILAILAAILVPALLGYIDKAKEKQITTNAEAAYVAAQAIMTERYGKNNANQLAATSANKKTVKSTDTTVDAVQKLAGIGAKEYTYYATYADTTNASKVNTLSTPKKHDWYTIQTFTYIEGDKAAIWFRKGSKANTAGDSAEPGGWVVVEVKNGAVQDPPTSN